MKTAKLIIAILFSISFAGGLAAQENNKNLLSKEINDAAAAGDLNKVKALLEADSTLLETKDENGNTPLISACWAPDNIPQETVANYLLDKGANVNAQNTSGGSAIYFAQKSYNLTQRLITMGADVNVRAYMGLTPLHQAASGGRLDVAKLLIDNGADLNASGNGGTILQTLIFRKGDSNIEMAKLLIKSGAKLQPFSYGNTELHITALKGSTDMAQLLLNYGADINAVNEYGHTPLYYAAKHGHRKTAEALIAAGANKKSIVETNYGKSPQLSAPLNDGEVYLWYLNTRSSPYDSYALKTKNHLIIFNPYKIDETPEAGLANGCLNPNELAGQNITFLFTTRSHNFPELAKAFPGANFIHNVNLSAASANNNDIPPYRVATPNENFSMNGIKVHAIPAMRQLFFEREGLAYLVEADGVKIFHSGLHASGNSPAQIEKYNKEIDFLKPFGSIDIAILPIKGRHLVMSYNPYIYLLDQLAPKAIYLIGDDLATDEHKKCIEVLKVRNIPVAYPEGGIAVGERFHYLRE